MAHPTTPALAVVLFASGLCCCGDLSALLQPAATPPSPVSLVPPPGEKRYVVSATTLKIRRSPDAAGQELAEVPHAASLLVTGASTGSERISGISGGWAPVWWEGVSGYAFDGYILPFPAPPTDCQGLPAWAAAIGHAGSATRVDHKRCAEFGIGMEGDCETRDRTPLVGGGWLEQMGGYEWNEDVLYLPGVSRDSFWAAARSCLAMGMGFEHLPLPSRSGPFETAFGEDADAKSIVTTDHWGWEWSQECSQFLYVEKVGKDAKVVFGGGC